jgi:hypothetical protein
MENLFCEICGGTLNKLGILGNREHYNCQQCGMETSINLMRFKINKAKPSALDDLKKRKI